MTRLSLRVKWWQLRDRLFGRQVLRPATTLSDEDLSRLRERMLARYRGGGSGAISELAAKSDQQTSDKRT
jgi:hypothetical protein